VLINRLLIAELERIAEGARVAPSLESYLEACYGLYRGAGNQFEHAPLVFLEHDTSVPLATTTSRAAA